MLLTALKSVLTYNPLDSEGRFRSGCQTFDVKTLIRSIDHTRQTMGKQEVESAQNASINVKRGYLEFCLRFVWKLI